MQLSLFDVMPAKIARSRDPVTSEVSAAEARPKLGRLKREFIELLISRNCPSTANEVASECVDVRRRESIRKRGRELVRDGELVEVGVKRCDYSGELATVFLIHNGA